MEIEIKTKLCQFLARFFQSYDLQDNEDIFALGFVNSLLVVQLVTFIEDEFEMTIDNEDLEMDNFRTINALTNLIKRKKKAVRSEA